MTTISKLDRSYYRNQRKSLSVHIPDGNHRILDVGCGSGYFGAYLKESGKANQVFGIELMEEAATEAATLLDGVICADLDVFELSNLTDEWDEISFDFIVCADVLEHVKNPWATLNSLAKYLKPGGKLIISIPNVRHWSVVFPLLFRGRWDYQDAGIMDRTHLRFFTKSTASELIKKTGLSLSSDIPLIGGRWRILSKLSRGGLDEFLAVQFVFVAENS